MRLGKLTFRLTTTAALLGTLAVQAFAEAAARRSETITSVLRRFLPPEDIRHSVGPRDITIQGPTYTYVVDRATGAIGSLQVRRAGQVVVSFEAPADVIIDDYNLASKTTSGKTEVLAHSVETIVLKTDGRLKASGNLSDLPYRLTSTFYNDGVVVSELVLRPIQDVSVRRAIMYRLSARGPLTHYLHKELNRHGHESPCGALPGPGKAVRFKTLTSCLQLFSPAAGLAGFTDSGGVHIAGDGLDTAVVNVKQNDGRQTSATLTQYIVNIGAKGNPYVVKAGTEFVFRVGIAVAPNRLPHPRRHDLRMFVWVGDSKNPYPTDSEIQDVAKLGFTLFQMHRLGTPGEPRPPAGELDRVIKTVHRMGMLFLWTANADLMYASAKGVSDLQKSGTWSLWQGFNYGGRYKAAMDPYCDLVATCLASPNGLADYRIACLTRMMDRYDVDGMYIDDNLAYGNCTLRKEHGHPRSPYDSLIELHEMNWRRRQLLRKKCPHAVLVDHCSKGIVLPVICDFDVHLYAEGYQFGSLKDYWDFFGSVKNMYAQGHIWAGDTEGTRCSAEIVYSYDLLTGGGQYTYLDWRLYPEKFPYASGVTKIESLFIRTYNPPQCYFGLYESDAYYFATSADVFATTARDTYATIYRNRVWGDYLIPVANMGTTAQETTVQIHSAQALNLRVDADYVLYDVNQRTSEVLKGSTLTKALPKARVPARGLKLFYLRERPSHAPYHLWGGKRISETWDADRRTLSFEAHGPTTLEDCIFIAAGDYGVRQVKVDGKPSTFFFDPSRKMAHGRIRFAPDPLSIEAICSEDGTTELPVQAITADELATLQ